MMMGLIISLESNTFASQLIYSTYKYKYLIVNAILLIANNLSELMQFY